MTLELEQLKIEAREIIEKVVDEFVNPHTTFTDINTLIAKAFLAGEKSGREKAVEFVRKNILWGQNEKEAKCVYPENLEIVLEEARTS